MKKALLQMKILCGIAVVCFIAGLIIAALSPDFVFIGIAVTILGGILITLAIIPAARLSQLQNKQKEERIKALEEEVEKLKRG